MNRLYLLGALALSEVSAYIAVANPLPATLLAGLGTFYSQVTYTDAGDCFTTGTATTLGMNNIYYQYYEFTITAGTQSWATFSVDGTSPAGDVDKSTSAVSGCTHQHLYNWMAQPVIGASTVLDGIGDALVAYGYVMSGSTLATCALTVSAVTTTLYSSSIFTGGRFQYINAIVTNEVETAVTTIITTVGVTMLQHYGTGALYTASAIAVQGLDTIGSTTAGLTTASASNFYYDFAQQQVVQGQTQFGRGGGASTAPCGWWVFYAHEGGLDNDGGANDVSTWNLQASWKGITVHMWTDNALMNTIGALAIATLATLY